MTVSAESVLEVSRPVACRRWTDEEKSRIVAESEELGSSVSTVARRHDLSAIHLPAIFVFLGKSGKLIKGLLASGPGPSLYAKHLGQAEAHRRHALVDQELPEHAAAEVERHRDADGLTDEAAIPICERLWTLPTSFIWPWLASNDAEPRSAARAPTAFVERFNGTALNEPFRVALRDKVYAQIADLQADLNAWPPHYNDEHPVSATATTVAGRRRRSSGS